MVKSKFNYEQIKINEEIKMHTETFIENIEGLLMFDIGEMTFCTDISLITVILKPEDAVIQELNGTELNEAQIQFNGTDYKLINLHQVLNLGLRRNIYNSRIILLDIKNKKLAFFADRINEILILDNLFIGEIAGFKSCTDTDYISGMLNIQNTICYFPDYERIAKGY